PGLSARRAYPSDAAIRRCRSARQRRRRPRQQSRRGDVPAGPEHAWPQPPPARHRRRLRLLERPAHGADALRCRTVRMTGQLYGIGVGPGDPELLTLKAVRLLRACPVVGHFAASGRTGNAWAVVANLCGDGQRVLRLEYPVTTEPTDAGDYERLLGAFYDESAAATAAGVDGDAVYVERASCTDERILPLAATDDVDAPYFSVVLVPGRALARRTTGSA